MDKKIKKANPWQLASVKLVELRFAIEDVFNGFTCEEKKDRKYEDLLNNLDIMMEHCLHHTGMRKYQYKKFKKYLFNTFLVGLGAFITKLVNFGFDKFFGGY
jgi:hypothetical protein